MNYDSSNDTQEHINKVAHYIELINIGLKERAKNHDSTKLKSPEKKYFDEYTPKLKELEYGSDKYKQCLKELQVALDHHYQENRHHPEHFKNGIRGMNLIDLIEMLCDWIAACQRTKDGDIFKSIEINQKRFAYSDDLKSILNMTADLIMFYNKE